MPEVSPIGKRIKAYREQAGLSQHGLRTRPADETGIADETSIARSMISAVECGVRKNFSVQNLGKIAQALGWSIDQLARPLDIPDDTKSESTIDIIRNREPIIGVKSEAYYENRFL